MHDFPINIIMWDNAQKKSWGNNVKYINIHTFTPD